MILVTGAAGFVGYNLVKALLSQHKHVRCLVRSDAPKLNIFDNKIQIIRGDLLDKDAVNNAVKGVQQIVHLAAKVRDSDFEIIRQVNVEGTRNLVHSSEQYGIEQFIFTSTLNVVLSVNNKYSMSKLEAEDIIQKSTLNFTILRPSIVYGEEDDGTIAKLINSVKTKKIIFLLGNGEYKLQPIYIDDVVKVISEILDNANTFKKKTFFLVGKDIVSYNELIDIISDIIGVRRYKLHVPLSFINVIVKNLSLFSKKGIQLEDKLKTYPFDKIVNEALQKDILPLHATSLQDGLSRYYNISDALLGKKLNG